tara:strand:- start:4311 stop:4739 length:429 start_codon:yes stop_codon:yes gene_type:complete
MSNIDAFKKTCQLMKPFTFDIIRVHIGLGLMIKGWLFLTHPAIINGYLLSIKSPFIGFVLSHYVAFAHLAGGLTLMIGLLTRISAAIQIPIIAGAIFLIHLSEGILSPNQGLEFTLLVLTVLVMIVFRGGGVLSIDYYLNRN